MFDFCLTLPYGAAVFAGGVAGALKGSNASLIVGCSAGLVLMMLGYKSYKAYLTNPNILSARFSRDSLVVSSFLAISMGMRFVQSQKIMPAGLVGMISALMTGFYIWQMFSFVPKHNAKNQKKKAG